MMLLCCRTQQVIVNTQLLLNDIIVGQEAVEEWHFKSMVWLYVTNGWEGTRVKAECPKRRLLQSSYKRRWWLCSGGQQSTVEVEKKQLNSRYNVKENSLSILHNLENVNNGWRVCPCWIVSGGWPMTQTETFNWLHILHTLIYINIMCQDN